MFIVPFHFPFHRSVPYSIPVIRDARVVLVCVCVLVCVMCACVHVYVSAHDYAIVVPWASRVYGICTLSV